MDWEPRAPTIDYRASRADKEQPSIEGIERVLEAGQRLLSDRLNLLKIELRETARAGAQGSLAIAAGLLLAAVGAAILLAAVVALLMLVLPAWAALAITAGGCLLLGGATALWGRLIIKRGNELRAAAQQIRGIIHPLESGTTPPAITAGSSQELQAPAKRRPNDEQPSLNG